MHVLRAYACLCLLLLSVTARTLTANEIQDLIQENENNATALSRLRKYAWVNSPTVRGSAEILWTCLITLFACIYTVLHLNIPPNTRKFAALVDKTRWVVVTLIVPELVVVLAARQLREALALRKELRERLADTENNSTEVNLDFCFFVAMGGFQVSMENEHIEPGPEFNSHGHVPDPFVLPVSPTGLLKLVDVGEVDLATMIRETHIMDRSKSNVLQKTLVLTQVLWMALQCVFRKAQGLPICLLETHTMAHVVCAVILYGFWIHKPLDISYPESFNSDTDAMRGFLALCIQSQLCDIPGGEFHLDAQEPSLSSEHGDECASSTNDASRSSDQMCRAGSENPSEIELGSFGGALSRTSGLVNAVTGETLWLGVTYKPKPDSEAPAALELSVSDIIRLERAAAFLHHIRSLENDADSSAVAFPHPDFAECLSERGNFAFGMADRYAKDDTDLIGFMLDIGAFSAHESQLGKGKSAIKPKLVALCMMLIYSGIHFSAWGYNFPTGKTATMWKLCCIATSGAPFVSLLLLAGTHLLIISGAEKIASREGLGCLQVIFALVAILLAGIVYLFRIFAGVLIVWARVCFLSLALSEIRVLPIGAYAMPVWIQMLPHL